MSAPKGDPIAQAMKWRNGQVFEHRLALAHKLGRALSTTETVHHRDGNRANNDPSNLELRVGAHGPGALVKDVAHAAQRKLAADLRARRDRRLKRQLRRHPLGSLELGDVLPDAFDFTSSDLRAALRRPTVKGSHE